jgi:energy-coupling factor transporter ATP-binding protein EcfA2
MAKLQFNSIKIRKAPGFPDGLTADGFDKLSPSINIITGPNGAGKSTIARVIQKLIWHDKSQGLNISGGFKIDSSSWTSTVDSDYHKYQQDGTDGKLEGIIAAESQYNYMLALHELINVEDKSLAEKILIESVGGFDLDAAQNELNYSDKITRKNTADNLTKLSVRSAKLEEAERVQKSIKAEEEQLSELKSELEKATQARIQGDFYGLVKSYLEAEKEFITRQSDLEKFPPFLKTAVGNELKLITDLNIQITAEEHNIAESNVIINENKNLIIGLSLPEEVISREEFTELGERINALSELEQEIANNNKSLATLESEEKHARGSIENLGEPALWKDIDLNHVSGLDKVYHDALRVTSQISSIEDEIKRLRQGLKVVNGDPGRLQSGISSLSDWLKEQSRDAKSNMLALGIALLAGIAAISGTFIAGKPVLWAAAFVVVLITVLIVSQAITQQRLRMRQSDFSGKGLKLPENWVSRDVAARVSEMLEEYNLLLYTISLNNSATIRIDELESRLLKLNPEKDSIQEIFKDLHERIKAVPGMPTGNGEDYSGLYWFIKHVIDWQKADLVLNSLQSAQKVLESQRDEHLRQCNIKFVELGAERAIDSASCRSIADRLERDEASRRESEGNIRTNSQIIDNCLKRITKFQYQRLATYQSLGFADGDFEGVRNLLSQLPSFSEANTAFWKADTLHTEKLVNLQSHSLYKEHEEELADLTIDQAIEKHKTYKNIASGELDLAGKISETELKVRQKKSGNELEELIADKQNALNQLASLYERNLSSVTGDLLVRKLRKITEGENQQEIFTKANKIFGTITRQRYRLKVNHDPVPSFIAIDNVMGTGLSLSELSTGTRVQLLLSVRLAFIETQEGGTKIPVLADELLANSDDERANAIIEALYEIAMEGRQVFYMTAQPDEVGKWIEFLSGKDDHNYRIIKLKGDQAVNIEEDFHRPDFNRLEFVRNIPLPEDYDIYKYRQMLNLPAFDLMTDQPFKLHIAFLEDDPKKLFAVLKAGLDHWGQLQTFYENGGTLEGISKQEFEKMDMKIKILEEFQELYRIGRPRTIDWSIIEDSKLVTDAFKIQVREKLDEANGDPVTLILLLDLIPNFRDSTKNRLRAYFIEKEYIDETAPIDPDEIRVRLLAKLSHLNLDPAEVQNFINGILEYSA